MTDEPSDSKVATKRLAPRLLLPPPPSMPDSSSMIFFPPVSKLALFNFRVPLIPLPLVIALFFLSANAGLPKVHVIGATPRRQKSTQANSDSDDLGDTDEDEDDVRIRMNHATQKKDKKRQ
jgi:hypothetical protein